MANKESGNTPDTDINSVCELLDKITLNQLHLMEDKMRCELNIQSSINGGSIHLAKSRYIMGQSSVSSSKLPTESSNEFSATTFCESVDEDDVKQFKIVNNTDNTVNPLLWFGVLVPQNLHQAQKSFQNAINYVVECVNIQLQLFNNIKNIDVLKQYKNMLKSQ